MKRKAEKRLKEWLEGRRRKPLVIRGARQVGKTTLVRDFAKGRGLTLNEVNLERHREFRGVFSTMDPVAIYDRLSGHLGRDVRAEPALHYWLREGGKNNAEVDYVVQRGGEVVPVEVKAGKSGTLRALRRMMEEKGLARAIRFDAGPYSLQRIPRDGGGEWELTTLPVYAASFALGETCGA